jgi:hypothetical protein
MLPATVYVARHFSSSFGPSPPLSSDPWLILGDFNIARSPDDRSNENFDVRAADLLNAFIDDLELQELPLLDRRFTWSNGRDVPTLVRLDRALINMAWADCLFNSTLTSLLRNTSDHVPLLVSASSRAPAAQTFRCEWAWAMSEDYRALIHTPRVRCPSSDGLIEVGSGSLEEMGPGAATTRGGGFKLPPGDRALGPC